MLTMSFPNGNGQGKNMLYSKNEFFFTNFALNSIDFYHVRFRGSRAVIQVQLQVLSNGPIRAKQVNQWSSVIGHIDELASTTC